MNPDPVRVTPAALWSGGCDDCTAAFAADPEGWMTTGLYDGPSIGGYLDRAFHEHHQGGHQP